MAETVVPITTVDLLADPRTQAPVLVLYAAAYHRLLPIWIDHPEARVIGMALNGIRPPRPLTHHLLQCVINAGEMKVLRATVTKMNNDVFFAELKIRSGRKIIAIDTRPSDAIALAILAKAPIFVAASILEKAGQASPIPQRKETKPLNAEDIKKISAVLAKAQKREEKS